MGTALGGRRGLALVHTQDPSSASGMQGELVTSQFARWCSVHQLAHPFCSWWQEPRLGTECAQALEPPALPVHLPTQVPSPFSQEKSFCFPEV